MDGDKRFELCGLAGDLSQAFTLSESLEPQVVFITDRLMAAPEFEGMRFLFYALNLRYVRILDSAEQMHGLLDVSTPEGRIPEPAIHPGMSADEIWGAGLSAVSILRKDLPKPAVLAQSASPRGQQKLVVIGASTGGIDALLTILAAFPADCPPTAIVQHTGLGFGGGLVRLLANRCAADVVVAENGLPLVPGRVCLAAGTGKHFTIQRGDPMVCRLQDGEAVSGHTPSVDKLFHSAAPLAPDVVGVLLTGMGQDGAAGLLQLRRAGCRTIGQDEATSTVYGMPKAAWLLGAVDLQLPIDKIASEILRASRQSSAGQMVNS